MDVKAEVVCPEVKSEPEPGVQNEYEMDPLTIKEELYEESDKMLVQSNAIGQLANGCLLDPLAEKGKALDTIKKEADDDIVTCDDSEFFLECKNQKYTVCSK